MKSGGPTVTRFVTEVSLLATLSIFLVVVGVAAVAPRGRVEAAAPADAIGLVGSDRAEARPGSWRATVTSPSDPTRRLAPAVVGDGPGSVRIGVDLSATRQTWTGVGGALTDSSVALLAEHPEAVDMLFDPSRTDGAHLNLVRLPLSATDFSDRPWTWEATPAGDRFLPTDEADRAVAVVGDIVARQPATEVTATAWTAPDRFRSNDGSLLVDEESTYAELLAEQAAWLLDRSVPLTSMSLGNEPGHVAGYPTMTMADDQMIRLAEFVKPGLDGLDVELWALDHNWADRGRADRLVRATPGLFDAVAFHCYEGSPDQMAGLPAPVIVTECTGTDDNWTSTFGWDSRVLVAESIDAGSTGLMMWNLALTDAPDVLPDGCAACRGLVTVSPAGDISPTPEYFTLAHLARAADPGAVVVTTDDVAGLPVAAFVNPDGTIGIFGHNDSPDAVTVQFDLSDGDRVTVEVGPWEMFSVER